MEWKKLLSQERIRPVSTRPGSGDLRTEYEKDYHRIIGSASFRRLQDKTQVFPLDKSDFIRTRLVYSSRISPASLHTRTMVSACERLRILWRLSQDMLFKYCFCAPHSAADCIV